MGHTGQRVAPAGKIEPQINADEDWPSSAALEIVASGPRAGASGLPEGNLPSPKQDLTTQDATGTHAIGCSNAMKL